MNSNPKPSPDDNYFIDKADDAVARPLGNSFVGLGTELFKFIRNKFQDQIQTERAVKEYAENYIRRYGKIKLLGMPQNVDLEDIYTRVKFLDKLTAQQRFGSLTNLENNYRESGKRRFQREESKPVKGSQVANDYQYLYILGNPGAGKSTFLRRVGLEALKGKKGIYKHECLPVMIELKKFNKGQVDLIAAITEELSYFNFPGKKIFTTEFLDKGKLLLLFDGLDEVAATQVDDVQEAITNLVTRYGNKGNRFILSCRTAANGILSSMVNFTTEEIADFDDEQIEKFIKNWFKLDPEDAKHCWEKLSQPEHQASKELAQTPLLLTFLCLVYDEYGSFPAIKSQLYAQALDILLYKWDREKKLRRDKIYEKWNISFELTLLTNFAYDFFNQDKLFFQKEQILDYLEVFLEDTEGDSRNVGVCAVLDAIAIQQGIFVKRTANIYSFSHLTLQEYLTAKYISQQDSRIEKLITENLNDKRWKEIFLLVAGIKDDSGQLLELMAEATHNLINTPKLKNLLQWVEKITDTTNGYFDYLGKRAIVNVYAFAYANTFSKAKTYSKDKNFSFSNAYAYANANALDFAIDNANADATINAHTIAFSNPEAFALTTNDKDFANANGFAIAYSFSSTIAYSPDSALTYAKSAIDYFIGYINWSKKLQIYRYVDYSSLTNQLEKLKEKISNERASQFKRKNFLNALLNTWFEAFHTTIESMTLSKEEIETLDNYIYANCLIIECKNAAVRVLQKTWNKIESRMLLPRS